jgi:hypothetical protein
MRPTEVIRQDGRAEYAPTKRAAACMALDAGDRVMLRPGSRAATLEIGGLEPCSRRRSAAFAAADLVGCKRRERQGRRQAAARQGARLPHR